MLDDFNLDLKFVTSDSLVFTVNTKKYIEIHVHMGKYQVMYVTVIVSDRSIGLQLDEKFLKYIDKLFLELEMKLCSITGFFKKEQNLEVFLHINFNSIRINFPPFFMYDENYKKIKGNISSIIFDEIKKINLNQLY